MGKKVTLTVKQSLFVTYYVEHRNATKAAILAGYSEKGARQAGANLMSKIYIQEAIEVKIRELHAKSEVNSERAIKETGYLATSDVGQFYDESGNLLHPKDMPEAARRCISSVKHTKRLIPGTDPKEYEDQIEIKLWDKPKCLDQKHRIHGEYNDEVTHKGAVSLVMEK